MRSGTTEGSVTDTTRLVVLFAEPCSASNPSMTCGARGWIRAATMNASKIGRSGLATLMKSHSFVRSPPRIGMGIGAVSSVRLNTTGGGVADLPFAAVDGDDMVAWVGEVDVYRAVVLGNPQVQP